MKRMILALLSIPTWAQTANPTQAAYIAAIYAKNLSVRTGPQVLGKATPKITIGLDQLFMGAGYGSTTLAQVNAYTDSIALATSWIESNVDDSLFVNGTSSSVTSVLVPAMQHAAGITGMHVKLNWSPGNAAAGGPNTAGAFAKAACNASLIGGAGCDTTTTPCSSANPCIKNFADFQTYALGNSGPVVTMLTTYGAPTALGAHLLAFNLAHELTTNMDPSLNPNWDGVTTGQGSPSDWAGYDTAAVTLIRAISGSLCTACGTMEISVTAGFSEGTSVFPGVCNASATINACGVDFYPSPTNNLVNNIATLQANFAAQCATAGKKCFIQETVPAPAWVPNYSPQSEANAYRGHMHRDWDLYKVQADYVKTIALAASAMGFIRVTIFDSAPFIWYTTTPSCPNWPVVRASCTAAVANCGNNGTQCGGDIIISQPAIGDLATYLAGGASTTALGQLVQRLNSNWMQGAQ